jgi:hypothetical protein
MYPKLITMLTYNDETVENSLEVFESCCDLPCDFWGFKDIGLPKAGMWRLVSRMKEEGKATFLEIVSLSERECMDAAVLAVECGFDFLMGTVFYPSVFEFIRKKPIRFFPFCGKVVGHPSIIEGTIDETVADGVRLAKLGVHGIDLLAYRFVGDPVQLARKFVARVKVPVIIAGSISTYSKLDFVKELRPWAFTIGSAFFEQKFAMGEPFRNQIARVLDYIRG